MIRFICAVGTLCILFSCSEKIDLIGDFKETAVVYGLLDHSDSLHYVKITRAFIGPGNAVEIAQIEDSSYFNTVDATIEELDGNNIVRTWILRDTTIENKDTNGLFYAPNQKVYYFQTLPTTTSSSGAFGTIQTSPNPMLTSLNPEYEYRLKAVINSGQFEVSSTTSLVNGITTTATSQNFTFKFASNPGEYKSTSVTISNSGNAHVVNVNIGVNIAEYIGLDAISKTIEWQIGESDVLPNSPKTFSANGQTFYNLVENNVTDDALIDQRNFLGFEVTVTGGSEDLNNYILVNQPSSSLAQNKPTYTNLDVTNGYRVIGIFSSRQTIKTYKPFYISPQQAFIRAIDKKSTRELCEGPITGLLRFCSKHPADNIFGNEETFACN
ncbi:MAG: hypothetical protein QNL43_02365 [Crocinitomicaceae bacterium]|jgi:hypothetical protein|tara:strand:+ start:36427 stop:37575 length:1149 start_codon:yes stop_codon:yes gene_type:complete